MKKKIIYAALVIACLSFFSFKETDECNAESSLQKCLPKKIIPLQADEEWHLSPLYNLLKI